MDLLNNAVARWIIQLEVKKMFTKLWTAINGYKTYALAVLGIVISVSGHFWGPFSLGSLQVPQFSWEEVFKILWNGGLFAALRHGADKATT